METVQPLANGLHTDHPIPDLPFVDDSHIPVHDAHAVEAIGRNAGQGMWGREDPGHDGDGDWLAFTTDPFRHELAWCVRYHPNHGRTVVLVRNGDAATLHSDWYNSTLLFRQGGYWWDGEHWYRPRQVWDAASQQRQARRVKSAITVTAADLLDDDSDPACGRITKIANFKADAEPTGNWNHDLALWAQRRTERGDAFPLEQCVVRVSAPELAPDQLIGLPEMADMAGIAAPTLRGYISRDQGDVPDPQAVISGRSAWARPVAKDWIEARSRSDESINALLSTPDADNLPIGQSRIRDSFTQLFYRMLWERPQVRKRFALRHRTEEAVRDLTSELGWTVAVNLRQVLPIHELGSTIRHAVLDELAYGRDLHNSIEQHSRKRDRAPATFYGITTPVAKMLDWFIQVDPDQAGFIIGDIVGEAERRLQIPREVTADSLRTALSLDGEIEADRRRKYLELVLPPADEDR